MSVNHSKLGVSVSGCIFLMCYATYVVFTTYSIKKDEICFWQRNLLYFNSYLLSVVTPLLFWSELFDYYGESDQSILNFTGEDMPFLQYSLFVLAMQIFSTHQIINVTRIIYELKGKNASRKWFSLVGLLKIIFYFLYTQCSPYLILNFIIAVIIDYIEHGITCYIYIKMLFTNSSSEKNNNNNNVSKNGNVSIQLQTEADTIEDENDDAIDAFLRHTRSVEIGFANPWEEIILQRQNSTPNSMTKIRAKWGLIAVILHMISVLPMFAANIIDVSNTVVVYSHIFCYLFIGFNVNCYKWLIVSTPNNWKP